MSAKIDLKFIDCFYDDDFIKVKKGVHKTTNKPYILITMGSDESVEGNNEIMLDKSTAIKFAKTLRTEINKIK